MSLKSKNISAFNFEKVTKNCTRLQLLVGSQYYKRFPKNLCNFPFSEFFLKIDMISNPVSAADKLFEYA